MAKSSNKSGGGKKGGSPPKSAFGKGKFSGSPGNFKKDNRDKLNFERMQNGVLIAWLEKANENAEAFKVCDFRFLNDNPDKMEELDINAIVCRKGSDGETPMKQSASSSYNWRQFVFILGEEKVGNEGDCREVLEKVVAFFNENATTAHYQYPRKVKLGRDFTVPEFAPNSKRMLDIDVLGLVLAAFPDTPIAEIAVWDEIVGCFWEDIEHGRACILDHGEANDVPGETGADEEN